MEEMVTIRKSRYDELLLRDLWLQDMEAAGVDNWQGIDYAYELRRERDGDVED